VIVEVSDPLSHPYYKLVIGLDLDGLDVRNEGLLADLNSLVRTEGGENLCGEVYKLLVILKSVCRIVCGANYLNVGALDKLLSAEFGSSKKLVTSIPDALAGFLVKNLVDVEISLKLKVCPMIEGVADKERKSSCKLGELLIIITISCDVFLRYSVGSHLTPFVVVTAKEKVKGVLELIILCDLLGRKVAMIVDNRKILYHIIELSRRLAFEHKCIVNKCFHSVTPSLNIDISL
jgi:hypothetical protein